MMEVLEITRRDLICARSVINASVMPSAKYSWDASPVRFSKGSTASERMTGAGLGLTMRRSESRQLHPATAAASITHAMLGHSHQGRGPDRTMEMDRAGGAPSSGATTRLKVGSVP